MIHPVKISREDAFVADDSGFQIDVVKETLRSIGEIPMLQLHEEQWLARRISVAKQRLRREMLRSRFVVANCVDLLRGVLENRLRMDRVLSVSLANLRAKDHLRKTIELNAKTLEGMLEHSSAQASRSELSKREVAKIHALIDESKMNTSSLQSIVDSADEVFPDSVQLARKRYEKYRNQMVAANLRLAVSVAKKYQHSGIPLLDLIQEGSEGLLRAAEKFEPERGFKFSTYAVWWIRQRIRSAVQEKSRVIRIGESAGSRVRAIVDQAASDRGELSQNVSFEDLHVDFANQSRKEDFRRTFYAAKDILSLDRPLTARGDMTAADSIEAESVDLDQGMIDQERKTMLANAFTVLSDREKHVMRLRFGLEANGEHNLAEVGRILDVSRERVRQIEKSSLKKLQSFFGDAEKN